MVFFDAFSFVQATLLFVAVALSACGSPSGGALQTSEAEAPAPAYAPELGAAS